jgi:hypothetical protein
VVTFTAKGPEVEVAMTVSPVVGVEPAQPHQAVAAFQLPPRVVTPQVLAKASLEKKIEKELN